MSSLNTVKQLIVSADGITPLGGLTAPPYDGKYVVNANLYTLPIWVKNVDTVGIQVSCPAAGTPNGSFLIQVSNDVSKQEAQNSPDLGLVNWSLHSFWDGATATYVQSKAVTGAQSFVAVVTPLAARWLRVQWTNTSGTANLTIAAQLKGSGGR